MGSLFWGRVYLVALRGPAFPAPQLPPRGLCAGNHHSPARVRPAPSGSHARSPHVGQPPRALPPPPYARPGSPDAGAGEVPGPPPGFRVSPGDGRGTQVAESRAAGVAPRRGLTPGRRGGEGGAGRTPPGPGGPAPSPLSARAPRTVLMRAAQPL